MVLPEEKIQRLVRRVSSLQNNLPVSISERMSVLGLMTSAIQAVQWAKFFLMPLQTFFLQEQGQEDLDRTVLSA